MDKPIIFVIVSCIMLCSYCEKVKEEDLKVYAFSNEGNIWMASAYVNVRFEIDGRHLNGILDFAKKMKATLDSIPYVQRALEMKEELQLESVTNIRAKGMVSNLYIKVYTTYILSSFICL